METVNAIALLGSPPAMGGWVYFMTNRPLGVLYVGVTSDLVRRVQEHREGRMPGFTATYGARRPVYYEAADDIASAIQREKNIKHWPRRWKIDLLEGMNPAWRDLWWDIVG